MRQFLTALAICLFASGPAHAWPTIEFPTYVNAEGETVAGGSVTVEPGFTNPQGFGNAVLDDPETGYHAPAELRIAIKRLSLAQAALNRFYSQYTRGLSPANNYDRRNAVTLAEVEALVDLAGQAEPRDGAFGSHTWFTYADDSNRVARIVALCDVYATTRCRDSVEGLSTLEQPDVTNLNRYGHGAAYATYQAMFYVLNPELAPN